MNPVFAEAAENSKIVADEIILRNFVNYEF
jgi:hypothetical protein